jgi:hypothetical protein
VNLDCVICNKKDSHLSRKCPIVKMPKPNSTLFGLGKSEFSFLQMPEFDYKLEEPVPAPTALVTISGGQITAKVLEDELAKLMRLEWKWEALAHGENSFLVPFPSEEEMRRMNDVEFRFKHLGVIVTFSEWKDGQEAVPSYELEVVWLHITGIPHFWRHYLSFWAVGTVVGSTLQVDMHNFRRKGVVCVQVGVLNKDKFPYTTDLVFGTLGYDITFSLEPAGFTPIAAPAEDHNMGSGDGQGEDHRAKDDNDLSRMKKQKMSKESHVEHTADGPASMQLALTPFPLNVDVAKNLQAKKTKETSPELAVTERKRFQMYKRRLATPANSSKVGIDDQTQDVTPLQQKSSAAMQQNLSAITKDLDRARPEESGTTKLRTPPVQQILRGSKCKQSMEMAQRVGDRRLNGTSVQKPNRSVPEKSEVFVGDLLCPVPVLNSKKLTVEGDMSAGSTLTIPASTTAQGCVSVGCQESHKDLSIPATGKSSVGSGQVGVTQLTDEDTMQKSMKWTAWKNLDGALEQETAVTRSPSISHGLSHNPLCLDALPDDRCASSLNKLGFSLGSSSLEMTLAIKALKNIDIDRSKATPNKALSKNSH